MQGSGKRSRMAFPASTAKVRLPWRPSALAVTNFWSVLIRFRHAGCMALGSSQADSISTTSTTERDGLPVGCGLLHGFPKFEYCTCVTHTASPGRASWRSIDASQIRRQAPTKPHPDSPSRRKPSHLPGNPFQGLEPGAAAKRPPCLRQDATSEPGLLACLFCFVGGHLTHQQTTGLGLLCLLCGDAVRPRGAAGPRWRPRFTFPFQGTIHLLPPRSRHASVAGRAQAAQPRQASSTAECPKGEQVTNGEPLTPSQCGRTAARIPFAKA